MLMNVKVFYPPGVLPWWGWSQSGEGGRRAPWSTPAPVFLCQTWQKPPDSGRFSLSGQVYPWFAHLLCEKDCKLRLILNLYFTSLVSPNHKINWASVCADRMLLWVKHWQSFLCWLCLLLALLSSALYAWTFKIMCALHTLHYAKVVMGRCQW